MEIFWILVCYVLRTLLKYMKTHAMLPLFTEIVLLLEDIKLEMKARAQS